MYAIANQKGGVGKTTTAVNLAACVAEAGLRFVAGRHRPSPVQRDGRASGCPRTARRPSTTCSGGEATIEEIALPTQIENLWLAPAGPDLAGATAVELPAHRRLGDNAEGGARDGALALPRSRCWTARPHSARSPSTRSPSIARTE